MTFVAFILTCVVALIFVVICGLIVTKSRFDPPYDRYTMWGVGGLAVLYLILALLGQVPLVPVPNFN